MNIAVSVICTVYNHEKFLEKNLLRLINQKTSFNYEIIVHDDASTDASRQIIEKYVTLYPDLVIPIYQSENRYSKGDFILFDHVFPRIRGKYVAFCEGDDYWSENCKLQMQYDALESNLECGMCVHSVQKCTEDGRLLRKYFPAETLNLTQGVIDKKQMIDLLYNKGSYPFHTSSYMIRADVLRDNTNLNIKQLSYYDIGLLRIGVLLGNIYFIDRKMSVMRCMESDSWGVRYRKASASELKKIYEQWIEIEIAFENESNGLYHTEVVQRIFGLLFSFLWETENIELFKEIFGQYSIQLSNSSCFTKKQVIIITLMKIAPKWIVLLKRIRCKMKKG